MRIYETAKFRKQRKRLKSRHEKNAMKSAVHAIVEKPGLGKKLKGEFKDLLSYRYAVQRQERRLVYKLEEDRLIMMSFGPREGIYR